MIDSQRWFGFSFKQQMGNIASELSRAMRFKDQNDIKNMNSSLLRLIELLDLTKEDSKNIKKLKELCRFKELIADWYCGTNVYSTKPDSLKNYAMAFVLSSK